MFMFVLEQRFHLIWLAVTMLPHQTHQDIAGDPPQPQHTRRKHLLVNSPKWEPVSERVPRALFSWCV
jgi:hypothetical protein